MSEAIIKKNGTDYPLLTMPNHYPADRVYLDGDTTKTVQDKCARKSDLTNLDLTGTTNTTGSTIASGTYFYLNGTLVRAKTAIASGATFTENTNYEVVTAGGLNALNASLASITTSGYHANGATLNLPLKDGILMLRGDGNNNYNISIVNKSRNNVYAVLDNGVYTITVSDSNVVLPTSGFYNYCYIAY